MLNHIKSNTWVCHITCRAVYEPCNLQDCSLCIHWKCLFISCCQPSRCRHSRLAAMSLRSRQRKGCWLFPLRGCCCSEVTSFCFWCYIISLVLHLLYWIILYCTCVIFYELYLLYSLADSTRVIR